MSNKLSQLLSLRTLHARITMILLFVMLMQFAYFTAFRCPTTASPAISDHLQTRVKQPTRPESLTDDNNEETQVDKVDILEELSFIEESQEDDYDELGLEKKRADITRLTDDDDDETKVDKVDILEKLSFVEESHEDDYDELGLEKKRVDDTILRLSELIRKQNVESHDEHDSFPDPGPDRKHTVDNTPTNKTILLNATIYSEPNPDRVILQNWTAWCLNVSKSYGMSVFPKVELSDSDVCQGESPFLLVLVLTKPDHRLVRQVIRNTWGSVTQNLTWPHYGPIKASVRLLFVMGHIDSTPSLDPFMVEEQAKFKDILTVNMTESYNKLTDKMISALHWVKQCCPGVKFVLKADEDTFVNIPLLVDYLMIHQQNLSRSVLGNMVTDAKVFRTGKWAVYFPLYPFYFYPNYASGSSYLIAGDALPELLKAVSISNVIPIEDAYITGILPKMAGIKRYNTTAMAKLGDNRTNMTVCQFFQQRLAISDLKIDIVDHIWTTLRMNYCQTANHRGLDLLYEVRRPLRRHRHSMDLKRYFHVMR